MSRLEMREKNKIQSSMEDLFKTVGHRIGSSAPGICPVDYMRSFVRMSRSQSCGKCSSCRIGLGRIADLLDDILSGNADETYIELIRDTVEAIRETADCAIGYEAAATILNGLHDFEDVFSSHITNSGCDCSFTQPVPCVAYCPANVDIPGYIALAKEGRYADAIRLIRKDNPLPVTCGYICEHPCESKCRRNILDEAVNIRGIKRTAAELAGTVEPPLCRPSTGKKVAIVGGGPAGLTTAYFLQLMGHQCVIYDMNEHLGGMLRYGIPGYRLPKDKLDEDIACILKTGVEVRLSSKVGKDIDINDLRRDYNAVIVAIGAASDKKLGLEGENATGCTSAVEFLRESAKNRGKDLLGKNVCIIGGGNVAMDAVRTAIRRGAKSVSAVYRRRVDDMTALPEEIESALLEGATIKSLSAPSGIETKDGQVTALWVRPQRVDEVKNNKAVISPSGEEDIRIECDLLIAAIGQDIDSNPFADAGLPIGNRNNFVIEKNGMIKDIPGVFAGGDCVSGPATVIRAIADAKVMAANVDEYLGYKNEIISDIDIPVPGVSDKSLVPRVNMEMRNPEERKEDFECVEMSMTSCQCNLEARRCLRCDYHGYGIFKGGREKQW